MHHKESTCVYVIVSTPSNVQYIHTILAFHRRCHRVDLCDTVVFTSRTRLGGFLHRFLTDSHPLTGTLYILQRPPPSDRRLPCAHTVYTPSVYLLVEALVQHYALSKLPREIVLSQIF